MNTPRPRPGDPRETPFARDLPTNIGPEMRDPSFREQRGRYVKQLARDTLTDVRRHVSAGAGLTDDQAADATRILDNRIKLLNAAMKGFVESAPEVKKQWDVVATKYRKVTTMKTNGRYDPKVWKFLEPALALFEHSTRRLP